jgi:release factor glutamine methyltransferase
VKLASALADLTARFTPLSDTPALDAQVLLAHIFQKPRAWVLAHPERELDSSQDQALQDLTARRLNGEPLPYLLGHWEFFGLDFQVTPHVLIPRPETELLVEHALAWLHSHPAYRQAIDIGTGSGCIAIALASHIPELRVLATDLSLPALTVARQNAASHGLAGRITFLQSNLLELPSGFHSFDLIAANLPYIPSQTLAELSISRFEPALALDGGADGLDLIRRLLVQAPAHLSPGGCLLLEIEYRQGGSARALAQAAFPQAHIQLVPDLAGHDRLLIVDLSPSRSHNMLLHLCTHAAWQAAQEMGGYQPASLSTDGFIHLSRPDQILKVANTFYRGLPNAILLWIDPARLIAPLCWEPTDGDVFPHLFGALNLEAVVATTDLLPDLDGIYRTINQP